MLAYDEILFQLSSDTAGAMLMQSGARNNVDRKTAVILIQPLFGENKEPA